MVTTSYGLAGDVVAPRVARRADPERQALLLAGIVLFAALFLQRFGIPYGSKSINVVGPIGLAVAGIGLMRGTLAFDPVRLIAFLMLVFCLVAGMVNHVVLPNGLGGKLSIDSLVQFLLLSSFATLAFTQPVDERRFFRMVTRFFAIISVAGLLQFAAQFVGISIFTFSEFLPPRLLFEAGYNLKIGAGIGTLFKSNGFFLIEPSVFSQLMALALIIEILVFRRPGYLALFMGGLLLSLSGTGWIVIASFIGATAVSMGRRGVVIAFGTVLVLTVVVLAGLFLAPDLGAAVGERLDEISRPGTSGHARFITPFWLLSDIMGTEPLRLLVGIGGGASENITLPYDYDVNTPVKVALEYGVPALIAYVLLFTLGRRTALQGVILVPATVLLLFTGGYQQFAPILFTILLITSVARLRPSVPDGTLHH